MKNMRHGFNEDKRGLTLDTILFIKKYKSFRRTIVLHDAASWFIVL
jgi:hypothetical protein